MRREVSECDEGFASKRAHLNDVIALSVASALEDVTVELLDEANLLVDEDVLESLRRATVSADHFESDLRAHLLHNAAAVHLQRELKNVTLENVGHGGLLQLVALLEELLDDVCERGKRVSLSSNEQRDEYVQLAKTSVDSWSMLGRISSNTWAFSSAEAVSSLVWMCLEPSWSPENSTT